MEDLVEDRHKKSLQYALNVLKTNYSKHIQSIYLYGSFARKDHSYNSDIDLLVCVDSDVTARMVAHMRSDVTPDDYELPEVELMISKSGLRNPSNQFTKNLEKEAVLLWKNH